MNDLKFDGSNWNETGGLIQTVNMVTEDISNKFVNKEKKVIVKEEMSSSELTG